MGMSASPKIHNLDPSHLDDIVALRRATDAMHGELHPGLFQPTRDENQLRADVEQYLTATQSDDRFAIGSVQGARVIGYALCSKFEHDADEFMPARRGLFVRDICVQPDRRGHGVGRAILDKVTELAREMGGTTQVHATVWEGNHPSAAMFRAAGFKPLHTSYALCQDEHDGT